MLQNELRLDDSIIITEIVIYIMEHKLYNKINLVKKLYSEYRVDEHMIGGYDDFIDELYETQTRKKQENTIEDTTKSLGIWYCFNQEREKKDKHFSGFFDKFIKDEKQQMQKEMKERAKEVGRNEACPCGSGKKYKKCCINKEKIEVVTPADFYIEKSLKRFPKEELKKFYDDETILIGEKIYRALKHKAIPIWVDRNYAEEKKRDMKNLEEAIELIKEKCKKENIKTIEEYNDKIAIHYEFEDIMDRYIEMIDEDKGLNYTQMQEKKKQFFDEIDEIFKEGRICQSK